MKLSVKKDPITKERTVTSTFTDDELTNAYYSYDETTRYIISQHMNSEASIADVLFSISTLARAIEESGVDAD